MTPNPKHLAIYYTRLATRRRAELNSTDAEAQDVYHVVTAILDPSDPPSVAGYIPRRIDRWHAHWLACMPSFDRVAFLEHPADGGLPRLWLLADWLDTTAERKARHAEYARASSEFLETRIRFWRVYQKLRGHFNQSHASAQRQIETYYESFRAGVPEVKRILEMLDYGLPVSAEDIADFERKFRHKVGHTYASPTDFTQHET